MDRKRVIKVTAYFLIFMFLAQLFSFLTNDSVRLLSHAENSKPASIMTGAVNADAIVISKENRQPFFNVSISKIQYGFTSRIFSPGFSLKSLINKGILFDMRQKIACIMSNYFHSAKYKMLVIVSNDIKSYKAEEVII